MARPLLLLPPTALLPALLQPAGHILPLATHGAQQCCAAHQGSSVLEQQEDISRFPPGSKRRLHASALAAAARASQPSLAEQALARQQQEEEQHGDEEEPRAHARAHGFVSAPRLFEELERQRQREQLLMGKQPPAFVLAQRAAKQPRRIFFPTLTLQMMRLPDAAVEEIRRTGWTREVAFRTTPNVTKLEIKAYLEQVYGMRVERVSTINYLGRKYSVTPNKVGKRLPITMREDDWKKAYVVFAPPPGVALPPPPPPEHPLDTLGALRALRLRRPHPNAPSASPPDSALPVPVQGASLVPLGRPRTTYLCPRTGDVINPHPLLLAPHPGQQQQKGGKGDEGEREARPLFAVPTPSLREGLHVTAGAGGAAGDAGAGAHKQQAQQQQAAPEQQLGIPAPRDGKA